MNSTTFKKYQINGRLSHSTEVKLVKSMRGNQPPKKNKTFKLLSKTIFKYSPRKKNAKGNAECSVLNPETSSDSASGKSKGERLVSAKLQIKNNIKTGHRGQKYQTDFCAKTI